MAAQGKGGKRMKNWKKISISGMVTAALPLMLGLGMLAACSEPREIEEIPETYVPCYTKSNEFVKWDDDCHDDGLVVGPRPSPSRSLLPQRPYGVKTTAPVRPVPTKVKVSPRR